jgi:hypothetical protein
MLEALRLTRRANSALDMPRSARSESSCRITASVWSSSRAACSYAAAGLLGHLRIRALLPLAGHSSSIAGHQRTVTVTSGRSPSPPSGKSVVTEGRVPRDSLAERGSGRSAAFTAARG